MTPRAIVFVATRLLALWCLVSSISTLAAATAMDWGMPGEVRYGQILSVVSLTVTPLILAALLWFGSSWVAQRLSIDATAASSRPINKDLELTPASLFEVGVSLLGVVVIAAVLPEFANALAFAVAARFMPSAQEPIDSTLQLERWVYLQAGVARLVSLLTRLVVGFILLLGPGRVWRGVRTAVGSVFPLGSPDRGKQE
jgi:hypothetical protein